VAAAAVAIGAGTAKVGSGGAAIRVSCPASSTANCTGSLVLRAAASVKVGSARYTVARGTSATLKVRLAKGSLRLVRRRGRVKVVAVATTVGATASSRQHLTLRSGAAR